MLDDKKLDEIEFLLQAFNFTGKDYRKLKTLFLHLDQNKKGLPELLEYIEKRGQHFGVHGATVIEHKRCKECNAFMRIDHVNTNKRNQTGDDSKYVYTCTNRSCMEQLFVKEI